MHLPFMEEKEGPYLETAKGRKARGGGVIQKNLEGGIERRQKRMMGGNHSQGL